MALAEIHVFASLAAFFGPNFFSAHTGHLFRGRAKRPYNGLLTQRRLRRAHTQLGVVT